jgi:hypothetical protein
MDPRPPQCPRCWAHHLHLPYGCTYNISWLVHDNKKLI